MDLEPAFLQDIQENPTDLATWLILADWLHERSDPRAELVQATVQLRTDPRPADVRQSERRVQELLARGVCPVVPTLVNSIGMELALIPAGWFQMGSPTSEVGRFEDEGPLRPVHLTRSYYLGVYPVTQEEYQAVAGNNPSLFRTGHRGSPRHPVDGITWDDANRFCRLLSNLPEERQAGRVYRLPTEAEWEYACRAGTTTPFSFGSVASSEEANFDGTHPYGGAARGKYLQRTTPVGSYQPNAWGLYDMHGNVREWCQDWYGSSYYAGAPASDPPGPVAGEGRVQRGGSWGSFSWGCRAAFRLSIEPDRAGSVSGFRVLMERR